MKTGFLGQRCRNAEHWQHIASYYTQAACGQAFINNEMPGIWKKITFSFASLLNIASVVLTVVALSTEKWVIGKILCQTGADLVNASDPELDKFIGDIYFGLFQGGKIWKCGLGSRRSKIYSKLFVVILCNAYQYII